MATEKLYKVTLIGLQDDKSKVLEFLQHEGVMHINPVEELDNSYDMQRDKLLPIHDKIADALLELEYMVDNLRPYAKRYRKNLAFTGKDIGKIMDQVRILKQTFHSKISKTVGRFNKNQNMISFCTTKLELLNKIPFNIGRKTKIPYFGELTFFYLLEGNENSPSLSNLFKGFKVYAERKGNYFLVQGAIKDKEKIDLLIKEDGFRMINVPELDNDRNNEVKQLKSIIKNCKKENSKYEEKMADIAYDHFDTINQMRHDLTIFLDRQEKANSFLSTEKTFLAEGYVPKKQLKIMKKIDVIAKVHLTTEKVEDGPTKFSNLPYIRSFEFITKMFGFPKYGRIDPTVYIAFFMPAFFGFMFSDVGYGFLLLLLSLFMLAKTNRQIPILTDAGIVLFVCSLSTILFGFLFGSFFGNLIKIAPILFDPFQNAKYILIASLAIGIIHMNIGLLIATYEHLKRKKYKDILLDTFSLFVLQAGVVVLALKGSLLGWILILLSVALLVAKSSIMGLMDVTGFIGTWFSYARLLALSLATGGIALGVNIMAEQLGQVELLGPVLFMFLIIFGHLFNFVLNVLGSSIHSVRLHYIEFFSQFFEAGGRPFKAFTTRRVKDSF